MKLKIIIPKNLGSLLTCLAISMLMLGVTGTAQDGKKTKKDKFPKHKSRI